MKVNSQRVYLIQTKSVKSYNVTGKQSHKHYQLRLNSSHYANKEWQFLNVFYKS